MKVDSFHAALALFVVGSVVVGVTLKHAHGPGVRIGPERSYLCRPADQPPGPPGEFRLSLDNNDGVWIEAP